MKLAAEFRQQLLTYQRFEITRHYIQGIRMGDKVIAVQAGDEESESVKLILKQVKASGIRAV